MRHRSGRMIRALPRNGVHYSCNTGYAFSVVLLCMSLLLLILSIPSRSPNPNPSFQKLDPSGLLCEHVLVTGGAGFLGSHLCEELLHGGACVLALDDLSSGSMENLELLREHPRFQLLRGDVRHPLVLEGVQRIYHLASIASPTHYDVRRVQTSTTNYLGTLNMLELASHEGARFLFTSTSEVYGEPEVHPQREDYWGNTNPVGPRACYHESKRAAEQLCSDFEHERGTQIRIARVFNTYGSRMAADDGRVVNNFLRQASRGANLTIYGDGSQTRSLCYVEDMIEALMALMKLEGEHIGPVNLGSPREISVLQLARKVLTLTQSNSSIIHLPALEEDPSRRQPDIQKAAQLLGWKPKTSLERGLELTLREMQGRRLRYPRPSGKRHLLLL